MQTFKSYRFTVALRWHRACAMIRYGAKSPNYDTYGLLRAVHMCADLLTLVS